MPDRAGGDQARRGRDLRRRDRQERSHGPWHARVALLPGRPYAHGLGPGALRPWTHRGVPGLPPSARRPPDPGDPIRALAPPVSLEGIVDPLGQYAGASWPGKVQSESDLVRLHELEAADLRAHPEPPDRDRFGGWRDGPRQTASGFFRAAKVDGKWWLVDPDGALFLSLGIDVVTPNEATIITGRESMFTGLPRSDEPLGRHFGTVRQIHSGPIKDGSTFNFYAANLERTYGPDFLKPWRETTLSRLKSWGFNTIANWSDHRLYRNGKVPYVATVTVHGNHARVGSGSDYWGKMHDPFDPAFATSVERSLRDVVPLVKGDPWCLGTFVDNELSWGGFGDEGGRRGLALGALALPAATSPAKRAFLEQLRKQYGDIARLNAAWHTHFQNWAALDAPWKPESQSNAWTEAFKADLAAFVKELARTYFKTVRDQLKAADPDHMYLGCRFAWRTEEAVAAAAEVCDVVSFNIYDRRVDPAKWAFLSTLNRPAIIGEFHVGALDRGMFHTGLVSASEPGGTRRDLRRLRPERARQPRPRGLPLVPVRRRAPHRPVVRRRELQHRLRDRDRHAVSRARRGGPGGAPGGLYQTDGKGKRQSGKAMSWRTAAWPG